MDSLGFLFQIFYLGFPSGQTSRSQLHAFTHSGSNTPTVAKRHTVPIWQGEGQAYWDCLYGLLPAAHLITTSRNVVTSSKLGFGSALFLFGN